MLTEKKSYKDTLNLPQTAFAMEAKLVQNEPARLKKWQDAKLYDQVQAARANDPAWVLHDGPPFANGDIHIGHVINKVLKEPERRLSEAAHGQVDQAAGGPLGVLGEQLLEQGGVDRARAERIDAYVAAGELNPQLARQGEHAALGRGVGDL